MTVYDEAVQLSNRLSLVEKVRLLEHLSAALKYDLEIEAYRHISWERFLDLTYGSLADDSIERDQPMRPDIRDEIRGGS